jgi:hypothetical protein
LLAIVIGYWWESRNESTRPSIRFPELIDLGIREVGEEVAAEFKIHNDGNEELVIDRIQTSCSCLGLERIENGKPVLVDWLRLEPRSQMDLQVRLTVKGRPGMTVRNTVAFRTNDPMRPHVKLEAIVPRVQGGLVASPTSLLFGTLPVGATSCQMIEFRDMRSPPRLVEEITPTNVDVVTIRRLSIEGEDSFSATQGYLIARAEVTFTAKSPGYFTGTIQIRFADSQNGEEVSYSARVVGPVEVAPSTLTLPRSSEMGAIFHADCICRSTTKQPLSVEIEPPPDGLTATLSTTDDPSVANIRIRWDPTRVGGSPGLRSNIVRLRVQAGRKKEVVEIPVICRK